MATTVLVVEDEKEIRELLRRYMERAGYAVVTTGSGAEAIRLLGDRGVDIAVLDLGLPDVDGTEVLREARERGGTPVVVLTARDAVEDRIRGLRLGADDYVTKPFSPTEVVLRVQAVLSRARHESGWSDAAASYGHGRLVIDEDRHEAQMDGVKVELTPTEWGLLTALASVPGRVYSRYELVNRVRGYEFSGYERTIDSHVKNLRHKLGTAGPEVVETVMGVGYRLGLRRDT
ncbi:response regulator transcription factor [Streptomyces sp. F63]|uniref:response regulator transcription factor n=1 Tax=Streptomyces sp. F63 TaxID=2824887 RepID=UPI001B38DD97|nr:response regulator transcription factor [Streptomyces sp. F63]MBQ0988222.1 response regulator transcription factor [Streptomyces sp. F63]